MLDLYRGGSVAELMIIYGLGASAVFVILAIMYWYASTQSDQLELTIVERFDTRISMITNLLLASVPLISVTFAVVLQNNKWVGMYSGFSYFLYPIIMTFYGKFVERKRKSLFEPAI
jgi:hypothetical protein